MGQIDAVIFDMDGVLCHLDDDARIANLSTLTGHPADFIRQAIWDSGFEDQADEGAFSAEEYLEGFGKRLQKPLTRDDWVAYRKSGMTPIPPMVELAKELSKSTSTCVLTNNGFLLIDEIGRLFPELGPIFGNRIWCSADFRCRKPSPEIYLQTCLRLGSEPARTLMIDDREDNIEGAKTAGLMGHLFKDSQTLQTFLNEL
jgi:glucose-1-phosphatase